MSTKFTETEISLAATVRKGLGLHLTKVQQTTFVKNFRQYKSFRKTCEVMGLTPVGVLRFLDYPENSSFKDALDNEKWIVDDEKREKIEALALNQVLNGIEEPIFHNGEKVGSKKKFQTALTIRHLEAYAPERFKPRSGIEVSGGLVNEPLSDALKELAKAILPTSEKPTEND